MVSKTYELNPFFPFQILISNPYWHQSKNIAHSAKICIHIFQNTTLKL